MFALAGFSTLVGHDRSRFVIVDGHDRGIAQSARALALAFFVVSSSAQRRHAGHPFKGRWTLEGRHVSRYGNLDQNARGDLSWLNAAKLEEQRRVWIDI